MTFALALRAIPATRASAWQFLAPVVAVVVELVFGDAPGAVVLLGMALAICGVALVSVLPAPRPEDAVGPAPIVTAGADLERSGSRP